MGAAREILVRVVSYRDDELTRTIASAWETADDAARVRFAIVNQYGPETSSQLDPVLGDSRVRTLQLPWKNARGLGWARRMTDRMRQGEAYTLQVDSHTRFTDGWDTALIEQWESRRDPAAVLSCYPGPFSPNEDDTVTLRPVTPHLIVSAGVDAAGLPRQDGGPSVPGGTPALLVSGGFQFSAGELCTRLEQVRDVMVGDEYVRALQLYTHGWNVTAPDTVPLFHLYAQDRRAVTHSFPGDFGSTPETARTLGRLRDRSLATARAIITGDGAGVLGAVRTRADFERELAELVSSRG